MGLRLNMGFTASLSWREGHGESDSESKIEWLSELTASRSSQIPVPEVHRPAQVLGLALPSGRPETMEEEREEETAR